MKGGLGKFAWGALAVLGAFCLGTIALRRGEQINALWIVVAAVSIYLVAYRYYSLFIADKVMGLDVTRATPAVLRNDGLDFVPTNKHVLFGHHFAAIAGAGPLVGPVLAAQMGYLPGMLWLIVGVVLAGAVQDFMVLFVSSRRDARSLGDLVREEMGKSVGALNPHKNPSRAMLPHLDFFKPIRAGVLQVSQFPDQLTDQHGQFTKPATW